MVQVVPVGQPEETARFTVPLGKLLNVNVEETDPPAGTLNELGLEVILGPVGGGVYVAYIA
jgi:hypothetical protein